MNNGTNTNNNRKSYPMTDLGRRPDCWGTQQMVEGARHWIENKWGGVGPYSVEHRVNKEGEHTSRVCSPLWCVVSDDVGNMRPCPPKWWDRMVEQ